MTDITFFNGAYLPRNQVCISPNDRGWLLGDGVYEVTPSYGGRFLRLNRHLDRLRASLAKMRIQGVDLDALPSASSELLERNGLLDAPRALVYFQISRGVAPRTHAFPAPPVPPTVYGYAAPFAPRFADDAGAAVITRSDVRWSRCDIKIIGLAANCIANQEAHEAGAFEAIFVRDGMVLEGTHTNLFLVADGVVRTAPLNNYVLPGVTRDMVLELCRGAGIPVLEESVPATLLERCEEVFLTGTTSEVLPVVTVDGRPVGSGRPGLMTRRIRELFLEVTRSTVAV